MIKLGILVTVLIVFTTLIIVLNLLRKQTSLEIQPPKRKRGRPKGSKNKPKNKLKRGRPVGSKNKPKKRKAIRIVKKND